MRLALYSISLSSDLLSAENEIYLGVSSPNASTYYAEPIESKTLLTLRNILKNIHLCLFNHYLTHVTSQSVFMSPTKLWPYHQETDLITNIIDAVQMCYTGWTNNKRAAVTWCQGGVRLTSE